ncbi:hypothetical protein MMPV_009615 [Pyropia vietnamensis]
MESSESARMPDGHTYNLESTIDPIELTINDYKDKLVFAVCPLASYDIILGKKWHEDYNVRKKYRTNEITFRKGGRTIRIQATLELPTALWSKQKLARHLKKHHEAFAVMIRPAGLEEVVQSNANGTSKDPSDKTIRELLCEYQNVFPDDLPKGLPPERRQL